MALQKQLCVIFFSLVLNMSAAVITCTQQSVSTSVGQRIAVGGSCALPVEGCTSLSVGGAVLDNWAPKPIVGKYSIELATTGTIKISCTFWGFDNMIGDREEVTQTFTQLVNCTTTGNVQETQLSNTTVRMGKSTTNAVALKPPASIPVVCLVADEESRVLVNFGTPNASAQYRSLSTGWKYNDELPLVASRPLSAWRRAADSTASWDAGSQRILRSIEAGPNSSSLVLVLKPSISQTALRGSGGVSWKVCIIPGDGYNYYPELCTETFPVLGSQAECDATSPTSGAAPLRKPVAQLLVMTFVVFCLASMRQEK